MLILRRLISDDDATVGVLELDGEFLCFTLEDERRVDKVPNETRIPSGSYKVKLRATGGSMNPKYAARYLFHQGMLHLQDVPGFNWIYIHVGNTDDHTSGCILVGLGANVSRGNMSLSHSRDAYAKVYPIIHQAMEANGGEETIEIYDYD